MNQFLLISAALTFCWNGYAGKVALKDTEASFFPYSRGLSTQETKGLANLFGVEIEELDEEIDKNLKELGLSGLLGFLASKSNREDFRCSMRLLCNAGANATKGIEWIILNKMTQNGAVGISFLEKNFGGNLCSAAVSQICQKNSACTKALKWLMACEFGKHALGLAAIEIAINQSDDEAKDALLWLINDIGYEPQWIYETFLLATDDDDYLLYHDSLQEAYKRILKITGKSNDFVISQLLGTNTEKTNEDDDSSCNNLFSSKFKN